MTRKFRILWACAVIFALPMLVYIIYPQDWKQTLPWLAFAGGLYLIYETVLAIQKKK